MPYDQYRIADFGASKAGLATVGYTLDAGRITAGIVEVSPGAYGALVTIEDDYAGPIVWDTGEGTPAFVAGAINPGASVAGEVTIAGDGLLDALMGTPIGGRSLYQALQALAAFAAGKRTRTLNADATLETATYFAYGDDDTPRLIGTTTGSARNVEHVDD